ncbi:MFS transporter [Streptomyces sp. NPDC050418]|uniref:MFS transporter n=1 Tax=Streptomyces sp. NPDC050418 TaxID=3365612 RepID=UPI00379E1E13
MADFKTAPAVSGSPADAVPFRGAWRTAWLLLAFMVVNFADKAVLGLAGPQIRAEFDISRVEFGAAQTAFFSLFSLAALGVAALTRRVRTTTILLVLVVLWSVAQLPMLWGAAGFAVLVATRVLLGAAEGPAAPVALHHVHGWFPQQERSLPTAVLMVGAAVGVAVASPVLTVVIAHWGWRWAFGVMGLAGLVWAAAWARWGADGPLAPPVTRKSDSAAAAVASDGPPLRTILRTGTFITAAFGSFAAYWWMSSLLTWTPDYLQNVMGLELHQAGTLVGAGGLANGLVLLGHGLMSQRLARRNGRRALPAGAGAGLLLLASGLATAVFGLADPVAVKVLMMLGPMALGLVMLTIATTACAQITPASQRGVVLGVLTFVYALGGILAPVILGTLVDGAATVPAGYENGWLFTAGLLATAGALVACFCRPERDAQRLGTAETGLVHATTAS